MALTSLNTIKTWFKTNFIPTQQQFYDMFDSFRHKNDKVAAADIDGIGNLVLQTLPKHIKTNESLSTAQRKGDVLYGVLDQYTGEQITLSKVTGTPTVDNIIHFQLGTEYFKRNFPEDIVKWFGAKGDGINDDAPAIIAALTHLDNIVLNEGIYKFATRVTIPPGKSITGKSKNSTTIYGRVNVNSNSKFENLTFLVDNDFMDYDGNGLVENTAQTNNVTFDNCNFGIENTTTVIATLGIFTFNYGINNLKFTKCEFTAPFISINAIKFVQDISTGKIAKNIKFDKCSFHDIGRIGIEVWSVVNGDNTIASIDGFSVTNCDFENIGIIVNDVTGIGVSLSGYVFNSKINNNTFNNVKGIGIELTRFHTGTSVKGNAFYNCKNSTNPVISGTLDEGAVGYVSGAVISGNIINDSNGLYLPNVNESVIKGNVFIKSTFGEIGGANNFIVDNQIASLKTGELTPFYLNNLSKSTIKSNRVVTPTITLTQLFSLNGTSIQNVFSNNEGMILNSNYYVLSNGTNTVNKFSDANTNIVLDNIKRSETGLSIVGDVIDVTWNLDNVTVNANSFVEYGDTIYTDYATARKIFEIATPCNLKGCIAVVYLTGMNSYKLRITNPTSANITLNGESFPNASPASDLNWIWSVFIKYI